MPPRKKIAKLTLIRSPWKVGDLLAYKLMNENTKELGRFGDYVLLRVIFISKSFYTKVDEEEVFDELPVIGLYSWSGKDIPPASIAERYEFIPFKDYDDPLFGQCVDTFAAMSWTTNKELKQRDIVVIGHDSSYSKTLPDFFNLDVEGNITSGFGSLLLGFNNLDYCIAAALKNCSQKNLKLK